MTFIKQLKLAAVALAFGAAGAQAATVGLPITIQESGVGAAANQFVATQLSGQYDEVVTFIDASHFTTAAIFNAGQWFRNSTPLSTQLNGFGAGYGIYAKFIGSGTYATDLSGNTVFNASYNAIELYVDRNKDTVYNVGTTAGLSPSFSALSLATAGTAADDLLLGSASLTLLAEGNSKPGVANGNFEILFGDFTLTNPTGEAYFIAPRPFYVKLDLNGNFQGITPSAGTSIQLLGNSANAFFVPVPEPGALALVGAAFLAVGVASKRRKSA